MTKLSEGLERMLDVVRLTHEFQAIQRQIHVTGTHRWENDAEHVAQLCMMGWYIAFLLKERGVELDLRKIFCYIIVHDLPELHHSGGFDVCGFSSSPADVAAKARQEKQTIKRLARRLKHFPELIQALHDYEHKVDAEARFVYAMDKLIPFYNIYLNGGYTWKSRGDTMDQAISLKAAKMAESTWINQFWYEFLPILEAEKDELFCPETDQLELFKLREVQSVPPRDPKIILFQAAA